MIARAAAMAFLATLGACTTAKDIYLPSGAKGSDIRCDGIGNRMENCFQKASDICGAKGYDVVNPPGGYAGMNSLLIKCRE